MHKKTAPVLTLFVLLILGLFAGSVAGDISRKEALAKRIGSILQREKASGGTWAIEVVSLDTGEILYEKNPRRSMVPASNIKLFTTATALAYLGPGFTAKTSIYFDGALGKDGVLQGNLIMYGRGDPNISGRFTDTPTTIFEQMAASLKSLGLREVRGDIIGDDSYFDAQYYGPWLPKESHKWYAARVSALSFNDNCIDIYVRPGSKPGQKANVTKSPQTSFAKVINKALATSRRENSLWVSPLENGRDILVGGKLWTGKDEEELWFPVESPPLYAATVFMEALERAGIDVAGKARALGKDHKTAVPKGAKPVIEHESLPLSELIKVVNKRSQNLHAELLLKQIGLQEQLGPSFAGGIEAVRDFVRSAGIDPESVVIHDGSGLCRKNRATAHSIVHLLKYMHAGRHRNMFRESLAIAGIDNSLRSMKRVVPEGTIRAKTGSLKGVLALSGYAEGESANLAFAIIVNDFKGESRKMWGVRDKICAELATY